MRGSLLVAAATAALLMGGTATAATLSIGFGDTAEFGPKPNPNVNIEDVVATVSFDFGGLIFPVSGTGSWTAGGASLTGSGPAGSDNGGPFAWFLSNDDPDTLTGVTIDLNPRFAFDVNDPSPGTGDVGYTFDLRFVDPSDPDGTIFVEYDEYRQLTPADQWGLLTIDLTGLTGGGLETNEEISFYQDVDVVPLPAAAWFLISGLLALMAIRRRKSATA